MSLSTLFMPPTVMASLANVQAATADTVVAIPLRDGFDVIFAVTGGLIGATFLAVLLAFLFLFVQTRRVSRAVTETRKRIATDPALEHLRKTASNVEEISGTLRDEVGRLSKSVGDLSDRLHQASERMEERIEEFNALMEVVQSEAEGVFVDTASTARGVRKGFGKLSQPRPPRRQDRHAAGDGQGALQTDPVLDDPPGAAEDRRERGSTPPAGDPLRRRSEADPIPPDSEETQT